MEVLNVFDVDGYGTATVAKWGGYLVQVVPMIFNDRIVLTPEATPYVYDYGWCYDKGPAAILAVRAWDPETEAEPPGYKKAVVTGRRAGEKAGDSGHGVAYLEMINQLLGADLRETSEEEGK